MSILLNDGYLASNGSADKYLPLDARMKPEASKGEKARGQSRLKAAMEPISLSKTSKMRLYEKEKANVPGPDVMVWWP